MPLNPMVMQLDGVVGDDWAYNSIVYSDVPEGFRFADLTPNTDCPLTTGLWSALAEKLDLVYMDHEIVGRTFADFFTNLQRAYALNADTFERLLEVYEDDIAKPILGRTETVRYGTDTDPVTIEDTHTDTQVHKGSTSHFDVPVDGDEGNASMRDDSTSSIESGTIVDKRTHKGTVTTTLSDLGVRPNYETLNGFLDNNRTALKVLTDIFRDCFTLHIAIRW